MALVKYSELTVQDLQSRLEYLCDVIETTDDVILKLRALQERIELRKAIVKRMI